VIRSTLFLLAVATAPALTPTPAAQPSAPPEPQPSATQLREIGHAEATICGQLFGHANGAISHVFHNDHTIVATITSLRALDFSTATTKSESVRDLLAETHSLREETSKGEAELKALAALESSFTDPVQQQGIVGFRNALSGVLAQQESVAAQIDRFLSSYGYDDPSEALGEEDAVPNAQPTPMGEGINNGTLPHSQQMLSTSVIPTEGPMGDNMSAPFDSSTPSFVAQERADALVKLGVQINDGESAAAQNSQAVMSGC
jgi:hypothetical protein